MSPSKQSCASWFRSASVPRPSGSWVAGGIPLGPSLVDEVSSELDDDSLEVVELRPGGVDRGAVGAELVAAAGRPPSLAVKNTASATAASTSTPTTTSAMTVPRLRRRCGGWPYEPGWPYWPGWP